MRKILVLSLLLCFLPSGVLALSCYPPIPSNEDIINAPVIFTGRAIEHIDTRDLDGKPLRKITRFEITKMYKGVDVSTIDIATGSGMWGANFGLGYLVTLMPNVSKDGILTLGYCSKGSRNQEFWVPKVKKAYATPFPEIYLMIDSVPYKFPVFIGFWLIILGIGFFLKRKKV